MPRASRYYTSGRIWHLTHRCHNREFLLKFATTRRRWRHWLFEARKRFNLCVLDFTITCNHIHLVVFDDGPRETIPQSMQLIAGRTAQEYNQSKNRSGPFWEDRYHATAIDSETHLLRCLVYVDLNMVRAGAVSHPAQWENGGYHEIQTPRDRYQIIDQARLMTLLGAKSEEEMRQLLSRSVDEGMMGEALRRDENWANALAVGSQEFIDGFRADLGRKSDNRNVIEDHQRFVLKESQVPYNGLLGEEKAVLRGENRLFFNGSLE